MISTNDLVEPYEIKNVHPKNKTDVGKRLAYMALNKTYHVPGIEACGPVYKSMEVKDGANLFYPLTMQKKGLTVCRVWTVLK